MSLLIVSLNPNWMLGGGGGGGGLVKKITYEEVLRLKSNPLPFYTPFLTEKVPVLYTFY